MSEKFENKLKNEKKTLSRHLLEWLATLAVGAGILFFLAPPSWWQFGPLAVEKRTSTVNFTLRQLNGVEWNFSEYRGSIIVVNYWATWCPPCRFETPGLVNIANEFKGRRFEMIGVTMDEDLDAIQPFIEKYNIKYPILLPGNDPNVGDEVMALPTTFLYDKEGRMAKKYTGIVLESTLRSDIEDLLKEL